MLDTPQMQINLRQLIMALEAAVDLVGINDVNHGKRVGYIASQIANRLGYDQKTVDYCFELGLIHDCGVSTEQMHTQLVNHFDWQDSQIHCDIGFKLLNSFEPLAHFATPVRYHHTPWCVLKAEGVNQVDAAIANLIFLADRIDVTAASHYQIDILLAREGIVKMVEGYSGSYFSPDVVEAFLSVERSESFWIALEDRHVCRFVWDMAAVKQSVMIDFIQLKQLARIMAYIVDQKSHYTGSHSKYVGALAHYLAHCYGLPSERCQLIEVAGYLHDIGKLHSPDSILEKQGPLSSLERSIMDQHSYETYEILRHIEGLEEIALWAAYHHESLDGTGYPFHPQTNELSIEARIIAVADVFQALVQDRPYREGMELPDVISILEEKVSLGRLDPAVVRLAIKHQDDCFIVAKGELSEDVTEVFPY